METNIKKYEEIIGRCFHIIGKWRDDDEPLFIYQDSCSITCIDDEETTEQQTDDQVRYILGEAIAAGLQQDDAIVVYFCSDNALLAIERADKEDQAFIDMIAYIDSEIVSGVTVYWSED